MTAAVFICGYGNEAYYDQCFDCDTHARGSGSAMEKEMQEILVAHRSDRGRKFQDVRLTWKTDRIMTDKAKDPKFSSESF